MVKPKNRGKNSRGLFRGGFSGRGRGVSSPTAPSDSPPTATQSDELSTQLNNSSSESDDSVYDSINDEASKTKVCRNEISIQASISSKSSPDDLQNDHNEPSEGEISFNRKFRRGPDYDFENSQNSHYMGPNYSAQSTPKSQRASTSQHTPTSKKTRTSTPRSSRESTWSDESDEESHANDEESQSNTNSFIRDYLEALHNKDVRSALSKILLYPILDRVRDLEIQHAKAEKKTSKLEKLNAKLEERMVVLEEEIKVLRDTKGDSSKKSLLGPIQKEITNMKHQQNINMRMTDQDRRNNLVITGVTETMNEKEEDTHEKIKEVLKKADIKIEGTFQAIRLGKPTIIEEPTLLNRMLRNKNKQPTPTLRNRPIKVCLSSQWDKSCIYKARTSMKDTNKGVFINEDLPKTQQTLLLHCRKARRQNKLVTSWTEDGVVHIKTADHDDLIITNLQALKAETSYDEAESK